MTEPNGPGPEHPPQNRSDRQHQNLDARIEQALVRCFPSESVSEQTLAALRKRFEERQVSAPRADAVPRHLSNRTFRKRMARLALSLALLVIGILVGAQLLEQREPQVVFQPTPLASIYSDLVQRGFQPHYVCDDPRRFRDTLRYRHGRLLALTEEGKHLMLGLSYTGGWTRETTAILFRWKGEPVVIFVDHNPYPNALPSVAEPLQVRRRTLHDIFLVEISPLPESLLDSITATEEQR